MEKVESIPIKNGNVNDLNEFIKDKHVIEIKYIPFQGGYAPNYYLAMVRYVAYETR